MRCHTHAPWSMISIGSVHYGGCEKHCKMTSSRFKSRVVMAPYVSSVGGDKRIAARVDKSSGGNRRGSCRSRQSCSSLGDSDEQAQQDASKSAAANKGSSPFGAVSVGMNTRMCSNESKMHGDLHAQQLWK